MIYKTLSLILLLCVIGDRAYGENPYFVDNLGDAIALSESSNKPILVVFGAEWCKYCKILIDDLNDEDSIRVLNDFIICSIDIDKDKVISQDFKVRNLPDSRILNNKIEIAAYVGYNGKKKYLTWVQNANKHK
jgi:thioredoxin-like negative regulator of GroEL